RAGEPCRVSIQDNIERYGASQILVDDLHALVNFTIFVKVINETVFHFKPRNAEGTQQTCEQCYQQYLTAMKLSDAGKTQSQRSGLIPTVFRLAFGQDHQTGWQ